MLFAEASNCHDRDQSEQQVSARAASSTRAVGLGKFLGQCRGCALGAAAYGLAQRSGISRRAPPIDVCVTGYRRGPDACSGKAWPLTRGYSCLDPGPTPWHCTRNVGTSTIDLVFEHLQLRFHTSGSGFFWSLVKDSFIVPGRLVVSLCRPRPTSTCGPMLQNSFRP